MNDNSLEFLLRNDILERLKTDEVAICMSVRLVTGAEIAQIAHSSGFDGFYIDLEHSTMSHKDVGQICVAALGAGITPLVRVSSHAPEEIAHVLDAGAMGVIVPHVTSADEAAGIVQSARFPPLGVRSVSPTLPQLRYKSWPVAESRRLLNKQTIVIAMIESAEAVINADEIARVSGIDVLLVGTNDLCADMQLDGQFDHPRVVAAYETVAAACRCHGKYLGAGGLASRPDQLAASIKLGARFVMAGSDLQFLMHGAAWSAAELRRRRCY